MRRGERGFTLVELLVGMAIGVGIVGSAYVCLLAGSKSQKEVESRLDILQQARVALDFIGRDLRAACPLDKEAAFVGMDRMRDKMEADNIDFATHNWTPQTPGEGDFCEVSYFVDRDKRTGDWALYRRRDPTPDDEPLAGGTRELIVLGVRALRFEYTDGMFWYEEWGQPPGVETFTNDTEDTSLETGLPEAVRVSIAIGKPADRLINKDAPSEPPLVFTTVVRLNLADRTRETFGGSSTDTSSTAASTMTSSNNTSSSTSSTNPGRN